VLNACRAAAEELAQARALIEKLETENKLLYGRLATEANVSAHLQELNEARRGENEALKTTLAAKNETIAAKESLIAAQERSIADLRKKKSSPWRRVGDILIGIAAGALLR
jgi:hypothetical protein